MPHARRLQSRLPMTRAGMTLGALLMTLFVFAPLVWMLVTSLKSEAEALRIPLTWLPQQPTLDAYVDMWSFEPFALYFFNSFVISGTAAAISTFVGAMAGYGFSRYRFRGSALLMTLFLATQMLSGVLVIGPYFRMASSLNLYDTRVVLILAFVTIALPFATWMAKGYFDSVPRELDEAALIDGCTPFGAFARVGAPVAAPGMVAALVFAFLLAWQDLLWALVLTSSKQTRVVTMGIAFLVGEFRIQWPMLMAASLLGSLPSVILYVWLERYLVVGLSAGSVKE